MLRELLQSAREYRASAHYSRFDSIPAVIAHAYVMNGFSDCEVCLGNESIVLVGFRRCCVLLYFTESGFVYSELCPNPAQAVEIMESAEDEYRRDLESAAAAEYPDRWRVHSPAGIAGIDSDFESESDARAELAAVIRQIRRQIRKHYLAVDIWRLGPASFECRDSESAIMAHEYHIGHYWIEHIDRSDDRERYLDNI